VGFDEPLATELATSPGIYGPGERLRSSTVDAWVSMRITAAILGVRPYLETNEG
jgi:hypothetical protein